MLDPKTVLESVFPGRTLVSISAAPDGNRKHTNFVRFIDGTELVLHRSSNADSLRTEAILNERIRAHAGLPVPAVVAQGQVDETGYLVQQRAPGTNLHSMFTSLPSDVRCETARVFGQSLAALHEAFQFDAYGPVVALTGGATTRLQASGPDDWTEWVRKYAFAGIEKLPGPFDDLRGPLEEAVKRASYSLKPPSTLYPWDFRPGNCLFSNGHISAFLDWGDPLAATRSLSLAKTEYLVAGWYFADSDGLLTAIREGYRSVQPLPDIDPIDRLVAVVRSAVDSRGRVTRPGYPERSDEEAVTFHRKRIRQLLDTTYR